MLWLRFVIDGAGEILPSPLNQPNTRALSLINLVIRSLALDLQTLLHLVETCKGISEILDSVHLPWQVAVKTEFWRYPDLDISSWVQTLHFPLKHCADLVSALHPLPHEGRRIQINDVDEIIPRYAGVSAY